jgi:glycosyltransferase involved in cell wall biosynthesis
MMFSIIIATYNAEAFIDRAIKSVLRNDPTLYELIIIDGKSSDKTMEIVNKYVNDISYVISEKDSGIYDAWNKGIRKAKGDWLLFIGSDDELLPNALSNYQSLISGHPENEKLLYVSSKMQMINMNGQKIRVKGWPWQWPAFLKDMTVAHPGSLHSKNLFKKYGYFDTSYRSAGDYELLLRPKENLTYAFMDEVTVVMQEGGISDSILGIKEHRRAAIETGGYSKTLATINALTVYLKLKVKRVFRAVGINAYLKKSS